MTIAITQDERLSPPRRLLELLPGIGLLLALQETSLGDGYEPGRWVQAEEMGTSLGEATRFVRNTGSMGCDAWNVLNEVRLLIRWIVSGLREARACIPG